jgi:archaellum component FlaC
MLIKQLEIMNCRKIRQATVEFYGPGVQVIKGANMSGKTTLAQAIALTMNGVKDYTPGMISHGEEKAEIIAYTDDGLKIRTVLTDTAKQTVQKYNDGLRRFVDVSGGVRAFLNSICSGLEMPWTLRDMPDAKIIELLKSRCGIESKIAAIDTAIKEKETLRTEVGRDKKKLGDPAARKPKVEDQIKQPDPIDGIKAKRQKAADQIAWRKAQFEEANEHLRKNCAFQTLDQLKEYKKLVDEAETALVSVLASREAREKKAYTQADVDGFDKQLSAWIELKQKADIYEKCLVDKAEWDRLSTLYDKLTAEIDILRDNRKKILQDMKLGVKGLEIREDNQLYHNGAVRGITDTQKSCNWSAAESVQVFFGLGARFAGDLKVLCVDNAESLDNKTTGAITAWAESAGFLVILLRVAEVPETLEDGIIYVKEGEVLTK